MPAFVNSKVGSLRGTNGLEETTSWPCLAKKSKNAVRMSLTVCIVLTSPCPADDTCRERHGGDGFYWLDAFKSSRASTETGYSAIMVTTPDLAMDRVGRHGPPYPTPQIPDRRHPCGSAWLASTLAFPVELIVHGTGGNKLRVAWFKPVRRHPHHQRSLPVRQASHPRPAPRSDELLTQ